MNTIDNSEFIGYVEQLRKLGKFRYDKELADILKIEKTNFSLILSNKRPISKKYNKKLQELYPELKIDNNNITKGLIPFYESEVVGGMKTTANLDGETAHSEMVDAGDWFRDATGAMRVYSDSMAPKYPAGSIIAFKEVIDRELLVLGQDYVIETSEYRIIKRLQKNKDQNHVLACSYNTDKDGNGYLIHEPFEIALKKIKRLFKVLGKVERNESSHIVYNYTK